MCSRAVREEVSRDVERRRVVEAHRPAEHVELVRGAGADRIGAVFDEQLDDRRGRRARRQSGAETRCRLRRGCSDRRRARAASSQPLRGPSRNAAPCAAGVAGERPALVDDVGMLVEDRGNRAPRRPCRRRRAARSAASRRALPSATARRERDPALVAAFARERVLHVAQRRLFGCAGIRAHPAARALRASPSRSAFSQRLAALRRLSRVVTRRLLPFDAWRPLTSGRKKVRVADRTRWVGGDSLAADRRRPSARCEQCAPIRRRAVNQFVWHEHGSMPQIPALTPRRSQ